MQVEMNDHGGMVNRQIDPLTGFMHNPGYGVEAFSPEKKLAFIAAFRANGLRFIKACKAIGISNNTADHHYKTDPAFKRAVVEAILEEAEDIEAKSLHYAHDQKSFMDRAMQLRRLLPERYATERIQSGQIVMKIEASDELLNALKRRNDDIRKSIDAEIVNSESVDNQQDNMLRNETLNNNMGETEQSV